MSISLGKKHIAVFETKISVMETEHGLELKQNKKRARSKKSITNFK